MWQTTMGLPNTETQIFTIFFFLMFHLFPIVLTFPDIPNINLRHISNFHPSQNPPQIPNPQKPQTSSYNPNSQQSQNPPQIPNLHLPQTSSYNPNSQQPQNSPQIPNPQQPQTSSYNPNSQQYQNSPQIPTPQQPQTSSYNPNSQQSQNPPQIPTSQQPQNPAQNPNFQQPQTPSPNPNPNSQQSQNPSQTSNSQQPQTPPQNSNPQQPQTPPQNPNSQQPQNPAQISNPQQPQNPPQNPNSQQSQNSENLEFLNAHNEARVHAGEPLFVWDETLASFARTWANQRITDCCMVHTFGPYGENIFWGGRDHWTPKDAVDSWLKEHKFYNRKTNACSPGKLCGHYTQVVWRDSIKIGCARAKCADGGVFIMCNYDPPGNYVNENPFRPH